MAIDKEPIRVLMLFTILNRGGAESMVMNYYRHIDRSRVQFDFVVHREEKGAFEDEITAMGGKIYRMMPLRPYTFGKYKQQISEFFDQHPEYRIIHGHLSETGYFFYKEASKRHIPVIIAHAHSSHMPIDLKWIMRTIFKHRMRKYLSHYFACGTEAAQWLFGKKLAQSAIIQRNAIDTKVFSYNSQIRKETRQSFGISENSLVVCHTGSFLMGKNHSFILDVFHALHLSNADSKLILIGDGELKEDIKKKCQHLHLDDAVLFLGVRKDVERLLIMSDIFLFPSIYEGLPVSLVEAQSTGLPCLVSDRVPKEVCLTNLVKQKALEESAEDWRKEILRMTGIENDRTQYPELIAREGYDIRKNALWLQDFYLSQHHFSH